MRTYKWHPMQSHLPFSIMTYCIKRDVRGQRWRQCSIYTMYNHYTVCKDSAASLTTHAESHNTTKDLKLNMTADKFRGPEFWVSLPNQLDWLAIRKMHPPNRCAPQCGKTLLYTFEVRYDTPCLAGRWTARVLWCRRSTGGWTWWSTMSTVCEGRRVKEVWRMRRETIQITPMCASPQTSMRHASINVTEHENSQSWLASFSKER